MAENHKINHGESFVGAVHLVLADPPYNIPRVAEDEHSAYDSFTANNMKDFVSFSEKVMKVCAQCRNFCSALQFGQWYEHLVMKKVDGDEMDEWMAYDVKVESTIATDPLLSNAYRC